jgi:hypothetical protein
VIISVVADSGNKVAAKEEDIHTSVLKLLQLMSHNRILLSLAINAVRQGILLLSAQTMVVPVALVGVQTHLPAPLHSADALLHPLVGMQPLPKRGNPVGPALPILIEMALTARCTETLWFAWHVPSPMNT